MSTLNSVSETALLTLKARIVESEMKSPVISDPKGRQIFDQLGKFIPAETMERVTNRKLRPTLSSYLALRARKYDAYTSTFAENKKGLVVSLGCGFDTRYWRVPIRPLNYIEVDLPEVISLKKKTLAEDPEYQMIGCSVLDDHWIEQIASIQKENILFLAEGLFMYLPEEQVIQLFKQMAGTFKNSEIVFESVSKKFTRGWRKKIVESKMKKNSGTEAGSSFIYGLINGKEIESYAPNITVTEEWSIFEDPDIRPRFMRVFRHSKALSRAQWTIKASIE